jgi:tetratricopeptide (TPR) repeat protein
LAPPRRWTARASDDARGRLLLEEALSIAKSAEDWREVGYALCSLGRIFETDGDLVGAERRYREGLEAAWRSGDALTASQLLLNLGRAAAARGDYAPALALMEGSLALSELRHWGAGERGMALFHLGTLARRMDDADAARMRCLQSLNLADNGGETLMLCGGLVIIGGLEAAAGRFSRAALLLGAESGGRPDHAPVETSPYPSPTDSARYVRTSGRHVVRWESMRSRRPGGRALD